MFSALSSFGRDLFNPQLCCDGPKKPKKCLIHPVSRARPSSAVDFLEDDRLRLHASEAHISRAASRATHVGMYRAARKLQSPAVPATGGEDDLMDGEPVIFETEKREERPINTRAFNLLIHTVILKRAWVPHRWSATVWARVL